MKCSLTDEKILRFKVKKTIKKKKTPLSLSSSQPIKGGAGAEITL